jgi:hypothetical protein
MAFSGLLEDQLAIRALNESYNDAVFRRHPGDWGACWTKDSVWNLAGNVVIGRDAIVALWVQTMETFSFVAFFSQMGSLDIQSNQATGVVYTREVLKLINGTEMRPVGRYEDRYVKRDGSWLYKERRYTMLGGVEA